MSKVRKDNYVVIQGWMLTDLQLKGNELLVYAIIYGFSQTDDGQRYTGSLQYLADWTNSTKQGVMKNLKSLIEKGLLEKSERTINGVKFCEYYATKFNGVLNSVDRGMQQSLPGGMQQSLPNNKDLNKQLDIIKEIIEYLNSVLGTNFRYTTAKTQTSIKARLNEGFVLEDFKLVIDKKYREWKGTDFEKHLNPETLFGTKFEKYLNQSVTTKKEDTTSKLPDSFKEYMKRCTL